MLSLRLCHACAKIIIVDFGKRQSNVHKDIFIRPGKHVTHSRTLCFGDKLRVDSAEGLKTKPIPQIFTYGGDYYESI